MNSKIALLRVGIFLLVLSSAPQNVFSARCEQIYIFDFATKAHITCENVTQTLDDIPQSAEEFITKPDHNSSVTLEVRYGRIPVLRPSDKVPFEYLIHAEFQHLNIERIENGTFENATRLSTLKLEGNRLTEVPSEVLDPLERLITLSFHDNLIEKIAGDAFVCLEWLQTLVLTRNKLVDLPQNLLRSQYDLQALDVSHNAIKTMKNFPKLCGEARDLELVNLNHNALTKFDQDFSECTIRNFDLSYNFLSSVDFARLPRFVQKLTLNNNKIKKFSNLHKISVVDLDLSNNKITELGPIGTREKGLPVMQKLDLSHNSIYKISPAFFKRLGRPGWHRNFESSKVIYSQHVREYAERNGLEELDLSHNQIEELPASFFRKPYGDSFHSLDISYNKLKDIEPALDRMVIRIVYDNNPAYSNDTCLE